MTFDIAKYVAACGVCQMVKDEHKRHAGLLKPIEIPEWKWGAYHYGFCGWLTSHSSR
jgi:hypothetical protein